MQQREVQIYVQDQQVDLFKDERIVVTMSTQNFKHIDKVFTDYSQSFTIPATPNNNSIFSYWYENALNDGFNANNRVDARIEINHVPFRKGTLQLEEAEVKDGQVSHYKITFYGDVKNLFDLFGEDKLRDLDYSDINFEWTGANVEDRVDGTTVDDIVFPLISSSPVWTYGDAGSNDITTSGGRIEYDDLFPALSVDDLVDRIESKYSVTLDGNFRLDGKWTAAYLWWKNRENTANFTTEPDDLVFTVANAGEDSELINTISTDSQIELKANLDLADLDTITSVTGLGTFDGWTDIINHKHTIFLH